MSWGKLAKAPYPAPLPGGAQLSVLSAASPSRRVPEVTAGAPGGSAIGGKTIEKNRSRPLTLQTEVDRHTGEGCR